MFKIIDSTLREGEQSRSLNLSIRQKMRIALNLEKFGTDYIEITNPAASKKAMKFATLLMNHKKSKRSTFKSKVIAHVRCHPVDIQKAVECGIDGLQIFVPGSQILQKSHNMDAEKIRNMAFHCLLYAKSIAPGIELRFSFEDSFRSHLPMLDEMIQKMDQLDLVDRIGIADTLGTATPQEVTDLIRHIRSVTDIPLEFHSHNDTGCAVANSFSAFLAGATHFSVSILGLGERNGITPLSAFIARLAAYNAELLDPYSLPVLKKLLSMVSKMAHYPVPANYTIFGKNSFTHKAGIHTRAMLKDRLSYQSINPALFQLKHKFKLFHHLTGKYGLTSFFDKLGFKNPKNVGILFSRLIKGGHF